MALANYVTLSEHTILPADTELELLRTPSGKIVYMYKPSDASQNCQYMRSSGDLQSDLI